MLGAYFWNFKIWLHPSNSSSQNYYKYDFLARMSWHRYINGTLNIPFRSHPQVISTYLFICNAGQVDDTDTGDSPPIGDFTVVISFYLPVQVWPVTNFFDLGHFPYTNVLKIYENIGKSSFFACFGLKGLCLENFWTQMYYNTSSESDTNVPDHSPKVFPLKYTGWEYL